MSHFLISFFIPLLSFGCQSQKPSTCSHLHEVSVSCPEASITSKVDENKTILKHTDYTRSDSAKVVQLLKMNPKSNDVLFYARQFIGVPYVAATLEKNDPERLIVNLRQLDCTTLVETTLALATTHRQGCTSFSRFCENLMCLRYRGGIMNGYLSRLHYFTWWMHDNVERGNVEHVENNEHFTSVINVDNHYMSSYSSKYRMLVLHPEWMDSIATMEKQICGPDGRYLPEEKTLLKASALPMIKDGDIVAIVTRKQGIDYSHLGFAVWGKDGYLHLLNASSIHHKVVEEKKTLRQYLKEHPSSIGIRLLRLR